MLMTPWLCVLSRSLQTALDTVRPVLSGHQPGWIVPEVSDTVTRSGKKSSTRHYRRRSFVSTR